MLGHETAGPGERFAEPAASSGGAEPAYVDALVDPVSVFGDPHEVVDHPWFTDGEKRTILLSWARDELAIEQVAASVLPELQPHSRIDAVIDALSRFDPLAAGEYRSATSTIRGRRDRRQRLRQDHAHEPVPSQARRAAGG